MDILAPFTYMYQHIEIFIGGFIVLILLLGIVFMWRMLNEKPQAAAASNLDVDQLENTLKRLINQAQAVTSSAGAASAVGATAATPGAGASAVPGGNLDAAGTAKLQDLLAEREKAIADLQAALTEAKKTVNNGNGEHALQLLEMQNKVRDLEARLAEYSIIEDDIADLSMYKEENLRLKKELQDLKGGAPVAQAAPAAAAAPAATTAATPAASEPSIVDQFAAAVQQQAPPKVDAGKAVAVEDEDPLGGSLDTSKMLEEMDNLKAEDSDDDVLADALDTDKLMQELGGFGAPATGGGGDLSPEEDLFGEFKDEEKT